MSEGQGTFTLDREKALQKLAAFQLPFQGAWVLKVVQAAVVGGSFEEIRICLKRSECCILFDSRVDWNLERLEVELSSPEDSSDGIYRHLITALRGIAFRERRSFLFVPQDSREGLLWNGDSFQTVVTEMSKEVCTLSVTHLPPKEGNIFSRNFGSKRAGETAALTRVLASRCFACPVPIYLDKRRLDSFMLNPLHGLTASSCPYEVFSHDCESLPKWNQPVTGVAIPDSPHSSHFFGSMKSFMENTLNSGNLPTRSSVTHFLCAHFKCESSGDSISWTTQKMESQIYWISDGVLIDQEDILPRASEISSCLYLSVEGLETDLTGFSLLQSEQRKNRVSQALDLVRDDAASSSFDSLEIDSKDLGDSPVFQGIIGVIMAPIIVGLKPIAIPVALAMGGVTSASSFYQGRQSKKKIQTVNQGLEDLRRMYQQLPN